MPSPRESGGKNLDAESALRLFRQYMETADVPEAAIRAFGDMYRAYRRGEDGLIPWAQISSLAPADIVRLEDLKAAELEEGRAALPKVAWIVLNGGLGTSMRMERAKSLVPVRGEDTFLDLLAEHVGLLRTRWGIEFPVLLMNSFATQKDTLSSRAANLLRIRGAERRDLPLDFLQHRFPRIREADGLPPRGSEGQPSWAPPGHGDLYLALRTSGAIEALIEHGIYWAYVSNVDNLGATLHPGILGLMVTRGFEFLMEVTAKTAADVKGGTLIRRGDRVALLEIAQVEESHREDFQRVEKFPFFNTNSLWLDLRAVHRRLSDGSLTLPLIVNRKSLDGVPIVQFETAMGAAVEAFSPAGGVLVSRSRFAPVKTTEDLLVRRSDAFTKGEDAPLVPNPNRDPSLAPPVVRLDRRFYSSVEELDLRIPIPPSLLRAVSLEVVGDVRFGREVSILGSVRIENRSADPLRIPDGAILRGE